MLGDGGSADEKSNVGAEVQTQIANLTSLKAKIDADTDIGTTRSDEKSIFTTYRIYMLVIPQGYIVAASDRVNVIAGIMTTLNTKLTARVSAAQTAGQNVASLQVMLSDMQAKTADATVKSQAAQSAAVSLVPDQGSASVIASNHTALINAQANIKAATADFNAAREDAKAIFKALQGMKLSASTTTSTTTN